MNPIAKCFLFFAMASFLPVNVSSSAKEIAPVESAAANHPPINNSEVVNISAPNAVFSGQEFEVIITLRNSGNRAWNSKYFLGSQSPANNHTWSNRNHRSLPKTTVAVGEEVEILLDVKAPMVPGLYPFVWQMLEAANDHMWFGTTARTNICVIDPARFSRSNTNRVRSAESIYRQMSRTVIHYSSHLWQRDDGLPQSFVQAIAQTQDGYIWIGTQRGLARFDGVRFTTFHPQNTPAFKSESIYALCASRDGSLWIGMYDAGLVQLKNGLFSRHEESPELINASIRALIESRDGSIWIGTTNGLNRIKDGNLTRFTTADGLADNVIRSLTENGDDGIWIGTPSGINLLTNDQITSPAIDGGQPGSVRTMQIQTDGTLWTGGMGAACLRGGKINYFMKEDGLPDSTVSALHEDSRGDLWVGTYGGLCRLTAGSWTTEVTAEGAAYDAVSCIMEDREGNIWIGSKDGLSRLSKKPFTTYTQQHGLGRNNVISVTEDKNGDIWAGTWGGGLNRLMDGKFTSLTVLPFDLVLSVHQDENGNFWAGGDFDSGLARLRDGVITVFTREEGLADPAIRVIHSDRRGNLWLGTSRALVQFKDGRFTRFTTENGLAGNNVRAICEDREENLWIGTNDGLSRYKEGKFKSFSSADGLAHNAIIAIHEDQNNVLWLGTSGGGMGRWRKERFTFYTSKQGLFSDEIHEIVADNSGWLWMSCRNGVFRVQKKDFDDLDTGKTKALVSQSFGKRDGLASLECNSVGKPAAWKALDGRLWFATTKGLAVVDPASTFRNTVTPTVVIEQIYANKEQITGDPSLIAIPPGRGDVEFHYTALSYTAPEKNRFKYKLEGWDSDWIDVGARREAFYNNVPPGEYTFRVIASNNDGVWNETGANVRFTLQPHYWQTNWFISAIVFFAIGTVAGAARYITWKRVKAKLRHLEQQHAIEKERTRIAQDMHDDLGARLSEILVLSNMPPNHEAQMENYEVRLQRVAAGTRELVDNLDAIVWAVNPKHDSLESFITYLQDYVLTYFESSSVRCLVDFPESVPALPLPSEARHNLFLVIKEALHNITKHAQASEVRLQLRLEQYDLILHLADNGKGFVSASNSSFGNGLNNMKERITKIGGRFLLESEPGKGTRLELRMSLKSNRQGTS